MFRFLEKHGQHKMEPGIERIRKANVKLTTVIDVGASNGSWSRIFLKSYPKADYLLVEAQKAHEPALATLKNEYPNVNYVLTAVGNRSGVINFDAGDLNGGLAGEEPFKRNNVVVPVHTVDSIANKYKLKPPFAIKLDTHGYEKQILDGTRQTLKNTNLLIIEAYVFKLTKDSLRFYELCTYLDKQEFYPVDIVDLSFRPRDYALWQMDIFFVRKNRKEFKCNSYD